MSSGKGRRQNMAKVISLIRSYEQKETVRKQRAGRAQTTTQTSTEILMVRLKRYHSGQAMTKYLKYKTDTASEFCSPTKVRQKELHTYWTDRQLPFQGDTHHEANTGPQTIGINLKDDVNLLFLSLCHLTDHAAELNEVQNEKVDDVDRSNMIFSHLQKKEK
ncbi:hypothetical protein ABVT39_027679 [Epinephelus coioides]